MPHYKRNIEKATLSFLTLNHASIIDANTVIPSRQDNLPAFDMADLERVLKEKRKDYKNVLIITDGVFSMDGDIAKLPEIAELAEKYEALYLCWRCTRQRGTWWKRTW